MNQLETQKREKILRELGKENPHCIPVMTPDILSSEFVKLYRSDLKIWASYQTEKPEKLKPDQYIKKISKTISWKHIITDLV